MKRNFDAHVSMAGLKHTAITGVYASFSKVASVEGVVIAVRYKDDMRNRSKRYVEYDVRDLKSGQIYVNCPMLMQGGGYADGEEVVLRPATRSLGETGGSFAFDPKVDSVLNSDGDRVLVAFVGAAHYSAVILGVLPHPSLDYGAARADGQRRFLTHKGTTVVVTKDGDYQIDHHAGSRIHAVGEEAKLDGTTVRLGFAAVQSVIQGDAFNAQVASPQAAAATELSARMVEAALQLGLGNVPGALGTVVSALVAYATSVQSALSAVPGTLSAKVKTE